MQPTLPVAGAKDGQYLVKADLSANKSTDAASFLVLGKEAAAAARWRDAEVAFLMSCRLAAQFKGESSVETADARYQLGRHYAQAAQMGAVEARRAELVRRSESLYSESLRSYLTLYGQGHEKSRFAAEGLAGLQQKVAHSQKATVASAETKKPVDSAPPAAVNKPVSPAPAPTEPAPHTPRKVEVARAEPPAPRTDVPPRARPSFDCARASSRTERLICSDAELAQLDRKLGQLHARARHDSADPAAFRRRSEDEWRRRESTCRDKECLLDWYAERREQLLDEQERR
ncbi:MAG: hypothetical protein ABIU58_06250 [Ramlibacter sp.]